MVVQTFQRTKRIFRQFKLIKFIFLVFLERKIQNMKINVIGLGYIGLPTAAIFASII